MKKNLFIWIPKTSGTSFYESFSERDSSFKLELDPTRKINNGTHGHIKVDLLYSKEELEEFKIFTIVRNPYSRFVSLFEYLKKHNIIKSGSTMCDFVSLIKKGIPPVGKYNRAGLSQCNPQSDWLKDISKVKVYKFENMNQIYLDFNIEKKWKNRSVFRPYEEYYTTDIRRFVEACYSEDFNLFNYDIETIPKEK